MLVLLHLLLDLSKFRLDQISRTAGNCRSFLIRSKNLIYNLLVKRLNCQARLSPPLLGQIVAEASIDTPQEYMLEMYNEYVERRNFLIDSINKIPGCYSPIPMGAFYTVARLPVDDADRFCEWCLSDFEYEGQTVFMAPASGFYTTPGYGRNEVRLAYVIEKSELAKAMKVLEMALKTYPGRTI